MKQLVTLVALFAVLPAGALFAKAPTLEEVPTIKKILEDSKKEEQARRIAEAEAKKDPKMELLDTYAAGSMSVFAWEQITDILKDKKEGERYRKRASDALRERFQQYKKPSEKIRRVMMDIGRDLIFKMNDSSDRIGRVYVYLVFKEFWPGKDGVYGFDPDETNFGRRTKAWRNWFQFLKKK